MKKQADKKVKQATPAFFSGNSAFYLLILILTLVLYGNSIRNGYAIDDNLVTNNNPLIKKGLSALPEIFTTNYVTGKEPFEYRPLVKATYAVEFQFFGANPGISHFINLLLYALTGMLLFRFLRQCFNNNNAWLPLLATLIFIAHPVHTEVVNNLKSRDDLLSMLFSLWAGIIFFKYADAGKVKVLALGIGIFALALLSKASCWAFIGIIPLSLYYFRNAQKQAITAGVSLIAVTGLFYVLTFALLPGMSRDFYFVENPLVDEPSFLVKIASAFYWLSHYIRLLIVPYPLAFYYGYNQLPETTFANPLAVVSLLFHLFLLGYGLWGLKNRVPLSFAVWVYLGGIVLFSNILVPVVGIVGERFLYVSTIGFCITVAYGIIKLAKLSTNSPALKPNTILYGLMMVIMLPFAFVTINRNADWKDALTLFRHDIKVVKNSAKAHGELALELRRQYKKLPMRDGKRQKLAVEAAGHFAQSLKIYPKNSEYNNYLGSIYLFEEHDVNKALQPLANAVKLSKKPPVKYMLDLANCYQAMRTLDSSEKYFLLVLEQDTMHIQAHYQLAKNAYLKGDTASAKNINRRFLTLHPDNPLPYRNQGDFYMIEGDTAKAVFWYKQEKYYQDRQVKQTPNDDE